MRRKGKRNASLLLAALVFGPIIQRLEEGKGLRSVWWVGVGDVGDLVLKLFAHKVRVCSVELMMDG